MLTDLWMFHVEVKTYVSGCDAHVDETYKLMFLPNCNDRISTYNSYCRKHVLYILLYDTSNIMASN